MPADPLVLCAFHASHADTHVHRHAGAHFHGFLCSCSHLSNTFHDGLPPVLPQTICHKCFPTQFYIGAVTHKNTVLQTNSSIKDIRHSTLLTGNVTMYNCILFSISPSEINFQDITYYTQYNCLFPTPETTASQNSTIQSTGQFEDTQSGKLHATLHEYPLEVCKINLGVIQFRTCLHNEHMSPFLVLDVLKISTPFEHTQVQFVVHSSMPQKW